MRTRSPRRGWRPAVVAVVVGLAGVACSDTGGDMGTLEDEADRLVAAVDDAVAAADGQGTMQVRYERRSSPCDPGRASVDQPMGRSIGHSVEVVDLDPSDLDDVIERVADAWGVEVQSADVSEDGTVVFLAAEGVTVSASSDKLLGRLSVTGETACHEEA